MQNWTNIKTFGAVGSGAVDDAPAIQKAFNWAADAGGVGDGGVTLFAPRGDYRLDSPVIPKNFVELIGVPGHGGTYFTANNATGAFYGAGGIAKARFRKFTVRASGAGVGVASAFSSSGYANQNSRCIFEEIDLWRDLGYGWKGNFITTKWLRGEWGYSGASGAQFTPIYCKGDLASGNQVNANQVSGQYILGAKGTDCLYFDYGSNVKFSDLVFENNVSTWLIQALGMMVVSLRDYYVEGGSGGAALFKFANDSVGAAQGTYSVKMSGGLIALLAGNTEVFTLGGASGDVEFTNHRVTGPGATMAGKHISGADDVFSVYANNSTPGLTVAKTPSPGNYARVTYGTAAATNTVAANLFDAATVGPGLYLVSAIIVGLGPNFEAEALVNYDGSGNVALLQNAGGITMAIDISGTLVRGTFSGGGAPQTISWAAQRIAQ